MRSIPLPLHLHRGAAAIPVSRSRSHSRTEKALAESKVGAFGFDAVRKHCSTSSRRQRHGPCATPRTRTTRSRAGASTRTERMGAPPGRSGRAPPRTRANASATRAEADVGTTGAGAVAPSERLPPARRCPRRAPIAPETPPIRCRSRRPRVGRGPRTAAGTFPRPRQPHARNVPLPVYLIPDGIFQSRSAEPPGWIIELVGLQPSDGSFFRIPK